MASWVPGRWLVEWHESLPSTNDRLKEMARSGGPAGTVVVARRQSAGRGRGDHVWTSPPGGLYVSVLLRDVPGEAARVLPLAAGAAILDALDHAALAVEAWVKWPNDILVAAPGASSPRGKAAGVLVESASRGAAVSWVVIGIGVNLHMGPSDLPSGPVPACSLVDLDAATPSPDTFLPTLLDRLGAALEATAMDPSWPARACGRRLAYLGAAVTVQLREGDVRGTLVGLSDEGHLRLDVDGHARALAPWDAVSLRPTP